MTQWKNFIRRPSFRGVPFGVDETSFECSKNQDKDETPFKDDILNSPKNISVSERTYTIEGFVTGDDYHVQRNRLIEALQSDLTGELIHPYMGSVQAICKSFNVKEGKDVGRMAVFHMVFTEVGLKKLPISKDNPQKKVESVNRELIGHNKKKFEESFKADGLPRSGILELISAVDKAFSEIESSIAEIKKTGQKALMAVYKIQKVKNRLENIISSPSALAENLSNTLKAISEVVGDSKSDLINLIIGLKSKTDHGLNNYRVSSDVINFRTRQKIYENVAAINTFVNNEMVIIMANTLAEYANTEVKREEWDRFFKIIQNELKKAIIDSDDDWYSYWRKLQSEIGQLRPKMLTSQKRFINPVMYDNALTFTYRIKGSLGSFDDFVDLNNIEDPRFLKPHEALEI